MLLYRPDFSEFLKKLIKSSFILDQAEPILSSMIRQKTIIEMTADFKAKKLTETVPDTENNEQQVPKIEYKVYSERWFILGTVVLLNFANYAHWIAFPAVAKKVI